MSPVFDKTKFTLETVYKIWNDKDGSRIEVGPDNDGLDLIEISLRTPDGKVVSSILCPPEQAILVASALAKAATGVAGVIT